MLKWLHDHFIPHEGNSYAPHFLRIKMIMLGLAIVGALEGAYLVGSLHVLPSSNYFAAVLASALVEQTNQNRITGELGKLTVNPLLEKAAQLKANDMAEKGYFAHNAPDGKTPWFWFREVGYDYAAAGENLAVNFTDSKDVTDAWMRSPTHRANILNGNYTEVGIATAQGTYKGKNAIFVVQEFGRPSLASQLLKSAALPAGTTIGTPTPTPQVVPVVETVAGEATPVETPKKIAIVPTPPIEVTPKPVPPTPTPISTPVPAPAPALETTEVVDNAPAETPTDTFTSTTTVAGTETQKLPVSEEKAMGAGLAAYAPAPSKLELLLSSPRQTVALIMLILASILVVALALAIIIKIHIQHPRLIANGVILLAIILSLIILNAMIGVSGGAI
jgi:hypothetical protein